MKLDNEVQTHDQVNYKATAPKFVGSINLKKGHKVFEYNLKTDSIGIPQREIVYNTDGQTGTETILGRIITKPDCLYIPALNRKNAIRKIQEMAKNIS